MSKGEDILANYCRYIHRSAKRISQFQLDQITRMSSSSDQHRRKRKRFLRQPTDSPLLRLPAVGRLLSVRSLVLCCVFLTLFCVFFYSVPFSSSAFHPVLVVSSLSLLSSSSTAAKSVDDLGDFRFSLEIENRVLFPDHVLLLVNGIGDLGKNGSSELECVYCRRVEKVLSWDGFDGFRAVVRCPLPSSGCSPDEINLRWKSGDKIGSWMSDHNKGRCSNWDNNVVYAAVLDGDNAVVFVKGLNLRPNRVSDPAQFSCHFANRSGAYTIRTKAVTAAQEIVRCALPDRGFEFHGGSVTIGVRGRPALMPSVARIFVQDRSRRAKKHVLCACTMVWNQATAMREWVMYHAWLGVQRWFVYDNNSDDEINDVVDELKQQGHNVTRHAWPWIKTQEAGFSHCALRARSHCQWVAFMDVDEYFHFPYSPKRARHLMSTRPGALRELVANHSLTRIAEIRTTCHNFGPSGLTAPPAQGVTVGYTCRLQRPERHKSIVRPDSLDATLLNVVHHFRLKKGFKYRNLPQGVGIVNHYKYQVWEVFRAKFQRRVATYVSDWQQRQNEGSRDRVPGLGTEAVEPPDWAHKFCDLYDSGLRDFVLANLVNSSTGLLPWESATHHQGGVGCL